MARNPYLTERMAQLLRIIDSSEDKELVQSPSGWYVGDEEADESACKALVKLGLLDSETSNPQFVRHTINDDGRGVMTDAKYVPKIVAAMKDRS